MDMAYRRYGVDCEDILRVLTFTAGRVVALVFRNRTGDGFEPLRSALECARTAVRADALKILAYRRTENRDALFDPARSATQAMIRHTKTDPCEQAFWKMLDRALTGPTGHYATDMRDLSICVNQLYESRRPHVAVAG